jgi:hypothetical protein
MWYTWSTADMGIILDLNKRFFNARPPPGIAVRQFSILSAKQILGIDLSSWGARLSGILG